MFKRRPPNIAGKHAIVMLNNVCIGHVKQSVYLRGQDDRKPVMLMLHGGPGTGQIGFMRHYQQLLERDYIVVQWDQRGTGLSYSRDISKESMTIDQFVNDTIEVTNYLLQKLEREKLILVGHSWGSLIGLLAVERAPHLYERYIGISQVVHQATHERDSYDKIMEIIKERKDNRLLQQVRTLGAPPWKTLRKGRLHQRIMDELRGGVSRNGEITRKLMGHLIRSKEYTLIDLVSYFRGMHVSMKMLQDELPSFDIRRQVQEVKIPVHFLAGKYDLIVPYETTNRFYEQLSAPTKTWYLCQQSAHSPHLEEENRFQTLLKNYRKS